MSTKRQKNNDLLAEFIHDYHKLIVKWSTPKVAEALGFSRQNAYKKIKKVSNK
jgi:biotin operon repressor